MKSIDYSWVIGIVILVALIILWKPIMHGFTGLANKATNKEGYERGKTVFYDTGRWGGEGSYMSCAMCHAADFVPDAGKTITMTKYKAGEPYILKNLAKKYAGGAMGDEDALFEAAMDCLTAPDKMSCGRVTASTGYMRDLIVYLNKQ
jgi:hypothetical protein